MQLSLKKRTAGRIEFEILFGFIALVAVAAARFLPVDLFAPACVFKSVTGFPCPACGSTRAVAHLAQGRFSSAGPGVSGKGSGRSGHHCFHKRSERL